MFLSKNFKTTHSQTKDLLWYNDSIKGGLTMNKTIFEQLGVTYTK